MNYYINATTEHLSNSCFSGKYSLQTADLQNVPFLNNDANNAFRGLTNLTSVTNMSDSVELMDCTYQNCQSLVNAPVLPANTTFMGGTFAECYNLVNASTIPNSVSALGYAFANCHRLVNAPNIPESAVDLGGTFMYCYNLVNAPDLSNCSNVTSLYGTFADCHNMVNAPDLSNCSNVSTMFGTFFKCYNMVDAPALPNNVSNMYRTFAHCTNLVDGPDLSNCISVVNMGNAFYNCSNLVNAPVIPESVTDMGYTFYNCRKLKNIETIPNNVTNMDSSFRYCYNLVNGPIIGNNVTSMDTAFYACYNLTGDIVINSNQVGYAYSCFDSTYNIKNVYIPFTYTNGVNTVTYNAFINAGYTTTGTTNGVYLRDIQYYNTSHTINVTTNPAEATVTFNSNDPNAIISGNSITAKSYSSLTITASYTGYNNKVELINPFGPWTNDVSLILTPEGQFSPGPYTADSGLTENNYVYSNFANTTGIQVPSTYDVIGNEIVVKFKITKAWDSEASGDKFLFGQDSLDIYIAQDNIIKFYTRNGPVTVLTPEINVWYWIKCKITSNNSMIISTSTDGSTWTSLGEQSYGGTLPNKPIVLGAKNATSSEKPFPGEIDMSGFRVYDSNGVSIWGTE